MTGRAIPLAVLAVPAGIAFVLLVAATLRTLGLRRGAAFWAAVLPYGVLRGLLVRRISTGLGGEVPYLVTEAKWTLLGVPLVEPIGWGVAAALGLLVALRFTSTRSPRGFPEPLLVAATLFGTSLAVECAAVSAGWWHWNVPSGAGFFGPVPPIGLIDWAFVATDLVLPFLAFLRPASALVRIGSLLLFPIHFGAHAAPNLRVLGPAELLDVAHLALLALLLALAFAERKRRTESAAAPGRALPIAAAGLVIGTSALVPILARRAALAVAPLPLAALVAAAFLPSAAIPLAVSGVAGALALPASVLAAVLPALASILRRAFPVRRLVPIAVAATLVAAVAIGAHREERRTALTSGLDEALALRDSRRTAESATRLRRLVRDFPAEAAPRIFLAEIDYAEGRLAEARQGYEAVLAIRPTSQDAWKHLVVLDLREKRPEAAAHLAWARRLVPEDLELRWLDHRRGGAHPAEFLPNLEAKGPTGAIAIAALAFEVDDVEGSLAILDAAIARFGPTRELVASRDAIAARR